jgi:hypothetical protein
MHRLKSGKRFMLQITGERMYIGSLWLGLVLCLVPAVAVNAEDDYLSILEAEAEETGASSISAVTSDTVKPANSRTGIVKAGKNIEPGLSFEAFEETLRTGYSGSNSLYVKLSAGKRKTVYRHYQVDNSISSIREEIVRLLSSSS